MREARVSSTILKVTAEALLASAVLVVLATDVLEGTPLDRWPFVVANLVIGLVGWVRPSWAGRTLAVLFGIVSLIMLVGSASLDASTPVVVGILLGPLVVGALFVAAGRWVGTTVEALPETPHKRLRCHIGLHELVTATAGDERFLRCKHCGKYGGSGTAWRAWSYRE
jgi:hypothetical protein